MHEFPLIPFLFVIIGMMIYVIPSIVAFYRSHPNRWIIFAINIAFGGTIIGWIGPLVWALSIAHRSNLAGGSHGGESGVNIFVNDEKRVRVISPTPSSMTTANIGSLGLAIAELERLGRLHADRHLNDDEYGQLKAAVLRRV